MLHTQVLLMSADEQTVLVVSYADLKACCERSFIELIERSFIELYNAGLPLLSPSFHPWPIGTLELN